MRITYDSEIDAVYIQLSDEQVVDSIDYAEGVTAEVDAGGRVVALEILDLHEHLKAGEALLNKLEREEQAAHAG